MKIIFFLTDYAAAEKIIDHFELSFVAMKPPPPQIAYLELLPAAETGAEYLA